MDNLWSGENILEGGPSDLPHQVVLAEGTLGIDVPDVTMPAMDSLPHLLFDEVEHDNISRLNHMGRVGLEKHQLDLLLFGKEGTTEVNVALETITEENNRALQRCGSLKCNEIDKNI